MWNFCDAIGRERENFISHKYIEHMKPLVEEPGNSSYHFFPFFLQIWHPWFPEHLLVTRVTLKTKKLGGLNFEKPGKYGRF